MAGKLFICATPIGNLEDITYRVVRTLREVDLIAAEDTRHSYRLLDHFGIKTPMTSYHEYNKYDKAKALVEKMSRGIDVAIITDAGTPAISDPGEELVKQCIEAGIEVTSLPGPAACITALTLSGKNTRRFCFEAFLPHDKKERAAIIEELKNESRTIIIYEAPHRLIKTVKQLLEELGDRNVSVCRELTKTHEEIIRTTFAGILKIYGDDEDKTVPRGEYVLVIEGKSIEEKREEEIKAWEEMTIKEHMEFYLNKGIQKKEAMKMVAVDRGISKKEVYKECINEK